MRKFLTLVIFTSALMMSTAVAAASFPGGGKKHLETCRLATEKVETELRLPKRLLNAISLTETGRWHKERREKIAWPWTVYSEGRGRYLPTKAAAIEEVRKLKDKGVKNIDVGCMQVNLYWHPNAFSSLEEAFTPIENARYAGSLLKKHRDDSRSWNVAIAHYHSQTKKYYVPYRKKVMKIWQEERNKDTQRRMAKARAAYEKRRTEIQKKQEEFKARRIAARKEDAEG
ncbi:hypothetical protein GUA87_01605 [Sneathiella sp. P13V-1]|uniref:hypothetical protein n=1 Tax=Sneathiella sp. P13V-1 TaxID=2697366 RepID=UPI00187B4D4D|nr:hypothetical protein [Sneathiella sp. P13V-1]MBE7635523.1 hypothetical protein [Sneathiella sp. P13V-1]